MPDYFIIGADAAGLSAAVQIKRKRPNAAIKIINKGKIISYGACGIPYVISGDIDSEKNLIHFTAESFQKQRGIPVRIREEATSIHPEEHAVDVTNLDTGTSYREKYGKLLIATGAQPIILPSIDKTTEGIFNVHDIEDLRQVLAYIHQRKPRTAAIIGAGNIGLEIAEAMNKLKIDVLLFDVRETPAADWPVTIQNAVIEKMEDKGVSFFGGTAVKSVHSNNGHFVLKTGQAEYNADIVFSVVGIKPATAFCGQKVEKMDNGAILIDRKGQTSAEDVYAAGDCASVFHRILKRQVYFPLGSTANKMGRISGLNMAGSTVSFPGIVGTQIFKFFELSMARTGLRLDEAINEGWEAAAFSASRPNKAGYYPGAEKAYVEIIKENVTQSIIGASTICTDNAAQFIDPAAVAVFSRLNISDLAWFDFAYAPPYAPVWNALISAALKAT